MSCTFHFRPEISFDKIKEFGFYYEYDSKNDYDLIISKRNPSCTFYGNQTTEEFNYLHALMGPNGGFVGFKRYLGNDSDELIEYLKEELGVQIISEQDFDLSYFIDAVSDYFKLQEIADSDVFEEFCNLLYEVVDIDDFIDFTYHDFESLSDWVPRNSIMIESILKEYGISVIANQMESKEKNDK